MNPQKGILIMITSLCMGASTKKRGGAYLMPKKFVLFTNNHVLYFIHKY